MRRLAVISLMLLAFLHAAAQTTKVRGRVTDDEGASIPFAAVFFEGTQTGVSCDTDGQFNLSTRDMSLTQLSVRQIGYFPAQVQLKPGVFNEVEIVLKQDSRTLNTVTVRPDNRKIKRLLQNIESRRDRNNPELRPSYMCDVYSKIELGLTHPEEQLRGSGIDRQWGFIYEYVDTNEFSSMPYLPVMFSESVSKRYHSRKPEADREVIEASRITGMQDESNLLAQFTGSLHLKNNFYDQFINVFDVEIPSPITGSGLLFYNYFIIDSLQIDGRKTYMVRYHPKPAISTPAFDGEMMVDASEYALRSVKARVTGDKNINWVRDIVMEASYRRMPDSTWFYASSRFYSDFSIVMSGTSKLMSFVMTRSVEYSEPLSGQDGADYTANVSVVKKGAGKKDDGYWEKHRPYSLSQRETDIYGMVDRIQDTPLYRGLYKVIAMFANGYYDVDKLGFGPVLQLFSYNTTEGFRIRAGIRTSPEFSRKDRFMLYAAFGCKDLEVKGGGSWEHLFSKEPTSKLTVDLYYDMVQLGSNQSLFNSGNILSSVLGAGKRQRVNPVLNASVLYEHEFTAGINMMSGASFREYFANAAVPMYTPSGDPVRSVPSAQASAAIRFSRDETVIRGHFIKTYIHTRYPVFTLDLRGGVSCLDYGKVSPYFNPELRMDWKTSVAPIGITELSVKAGTIAGRVPYTMLHLFEGNGSYITDKGAFSTMDYFEFAADSYATLIWNHNFYGFFLGKIPYVKKLNLRETLTFKAAWGYLSPRNDGNGPDAMLRFPENMHAMGKIPYIETGFGITNIFNLLRVDFLWRVTHRDGQRKNPRNFTVNAGFDIRF